MHRDNWRQDHASKPSGAACAGARPSLRDQLSLLARAWAQWIYKLAQLSGPSRLIYDWPLIYFQTVTNGHRCEPWSFSRLWSQTY